MFRTAGQNPISAAAGRAAALLHATDPEALAAAGRVVLAAMLAARHLGSPVDLGRVLEMAVVPALGPADLRVRLDPDTGVHLHALRLELETGGTSEARLVRALQALLDGRPVDTRDRFLAALAAALRDGDGASKAAG